MKSAGLSRKTVAKVAIVMLIVFAAIVVVYPLIFSPNESPFEQPVAPGVVVPPASDPAARSSNR